MLALFKGEMTPEYMFHSLTYKEARLLRDIRVKRLLKEKELMEAEQKAAEAKQRRESILKR